MQINHIEKGGGGPFKYTQATVKFIQICKKMITYCAGDRMECVIYQEIN